MNEERETVLQDLPDTDLCSLRAKYDEIWSSYIDSPMGQLGPSNDPTVIKAGDMIDEIDKIIASRRKTEVAGQ